LKHRWRQARCLRDNGRFTTDAWKTGLAKPSPWPDKVMALLRARNPAAAIAQIKVAPSVRELQALQKALAAAQLAGKWKDVDVVIAESLQDLSAPRLHRSP
jgi:hypothetical protein